MTLVKRRKGWRMSCDIGEVTEWLENEQSSSPTSPGKHKAIYYRLYCMDVKCGLSLIERTEVKGVQE